VVIACHAASATASWKVVLKAGPLLAEHIWSAEELHDCLILFSARAQNSLDSELWQSGDVDAVQQIP
jgi:hypothetical protein